MLPEVGEPETTFRVEDPAVAVMVTELALNEVQLRVTLWPVLIAFVLAEKLISGGSFCNPPHAVTPHIAPNKIPQKMQRTASLLIPKESASQIRPCGNQMPPAACAVAVRL